MEQGPEPKTPVPLPVISSTTENTRQNGNNDSDQYSDNEEGKPEAELACKLFKLLMNNTWSRRNISREHDLLFVEAQRYGSRPCCLYTLWSANTVTQEVFWEMKFY